MIDLNRTGGGSGCGKVLTDLEEQLLALLSKIHLGDPDISDSFELSENCKLTALLIKNWNA